MDEPVRHNSGGEEYMKKTIWLFILLAVSAILFTIGLSIPSRTDPMHIFFVVSGVVTGFIFYLITFSMALKTPARQRRMFWMIFIVCVPMFGNVIYLIVHNTLIRKQVPKSSV